ncbi:MAG: O-antigen ligase family protein [Candidatus Sericytochromatia bacterium]|nr:O-antigen ligase family protein [Candidatus Tanganyikabacteria bacterium]
MLSGASLTAFEGGWRATLQGSVPGRLYRRLRSAAAERIQPYLATSLAARLAPGLSLATLFLLLFLSPLVGTGLNALLVLAAAGCAALLAVTHPATEDAASPLDLPFLILAGILVVAAAASLYPVASAKGLAKLAIYGLAYLVFRDAVRRGGTWAWVPLAGLLGAALLESVYGLYQFRIKVAPLATWEDAESELHLTRVYGTLRNPNLLGGYLVAAIPLGLAGALAWRGLARWIAAGVLVLGPLVLYLTYSRGAYVALGAELGVLALFGLAAGWRRKRTWLLAGLFLCVAAVGLWYAWEHVPAFQARLASIVTPRGDSSNSFRMNVWRATIEMIRDSWYLGVGIGNDAFRHGYALYMISGFEALGAYNIFLEWAAEAGVFACLAFVWLVLAAAARGVEGFALGVARPWAAGAVAALAGLMVHGLVDTVFFRPAVQLPFWLIMAFLAGLPRIDRS